MAVLAARFLILLPALALSTAVAAQVGTSCDAPIDITSEEFLLEQNLTHFLRPTIKQCKLEIKADDAFTTGVDFEVHSEWKFTGHVRITTEGSTLEAQSAVFTFEKNQLARAELIGAPASFSAARAEPGKEPVRGSANKILLDYLGQTLRLSEHVEVTKDRLRAVGCDVIYDFKNETMSSGDANCGADGYNIRVVPQLPKASAAPAPPP